MTKAERWWAHKEDIVLFARSLAVEGHRFKPYVQQEAFLRCSSREIILNWCRQSGKTTSAAVKATHQGIFQPGSTALVMSVTQKQAGILQRRVTDFVEQYGQQYSLTTRREIDTVEIDWITGGTHIMRRSVLELELANKSRIVSVPAVSQSLRGYSPQLVVVDEASRVADSVYSATRPTLIKTRGALVLMSTPNGRRGFFYNVWAREDTNFWRSAMSATECEGITLEDLERERLEMISAGMPDMFEQEYFCKFVAIEGGIFTAEQLEAIFHPAPHIEAPPLLQRGLRKEKGEIFVPGMGFR